MKNKTQTELNKMTKKNLLLHIEKMQLMIENDYLHTQKENRELRDSLSNISAPDIGKIQKAAGVLRYQLFHHDFKSLDDKEKVLKMVDNFISTVL